MTRYALLAIVAIAFFSFAYASVLAEEMTFDVPFDYNKSGCTLTNNTETFKYYDCYASWNFNSTETFRPNLVWDDVDEEYKSPEQLEEEAKEIYANRDQSITIDEEGNAIDDYVETLTTSESELERLINNMLGARCHQGIGTTSGIQNVRSFDIPTITIPIYAEVDGEMVDTGRTREVLDTTTTIKDIDLRGALGQLIKDARECAAESILLDPNGGVLSITDLNFGFCDSISANTTTYLAICGKTYSHKTNAQDVPVWSQSRVNEEANPQNDDRNERTKFSAECTRNYGDDLRERLGCPPLDEYVATVEPKTLKDYHDTEVGKKYEDFIEDDGESMGQELRKKILQDKISELARQLRAWTNP